MTEGQSDRRRASSEVTAAFEKLRADPHLSDRAREIIDRLETRIETTDAWGVLIRHNAGMTDFLHLFFKAILNAEAFAQGYAKTKTAEAKSRARLAKGLAAAQDLSDFFQDTFHQDEDSEIRECRAWAKWAIDHIRARINKFDAMMGILPKPSQKVSAEVYFCTTISEFMQRSFGAPFDELVASIVCVVFDKGEGLDGATVRQRRNRERRRHARPERNTETVLPEKT